MARCTHNAPLDGRHLRTRWVAAPQCQPTNADSRRGHYRTSLTTGPAGHPTPLLGPHCRTLVPGPSPVTARLHRCDTHTLYTNGTALSAFCFMLIDYRKLDIDDSTWSASPPSLFVNMSSVYSINAVNRLTGLFPHG